MSIRFQADADLDPEIGFGLRRREPSVDFRNALGVIADGTPDPEVLRIAAEAGRVLVSRDIKTMPSHFEHFTLENSSPGLIMIPSRRTLGEVIEGLLFVWLHWTEDEVRDQKRWLPHPNAANPYLN